ncbi:MAG: flagellar type III secretion system pore protein FliP [Bacillota bacterium]
MTGSFKRNFLLIILLALLFISIIPAESFAQPPVQIPEVNLQIGGEGEEDPEGLVGFLQLLLIIALLTLAPAFVILTTAFTRIVIVLSFTRNAMATQQIPPNQVLIGLALFLTFFVMQPALLEINETAVQPYIEGEIDQETALELGSEPLRDFMYFHTRENDLALFVEMSGMEQPETQEDVPLHVLIPSFVISELKTAFQMGFMLYVPFLIIDMVVASTLMSMGMFMLPPVIVSMPFKLLLFILVDGWHLVVRSLLESFN